ncbi:Stp1/IreP family PP2C-type Ser/Thr phosphatase [Gracilibacillus sp. YIM 98692]|uniref:Stp1/IreP family PP2C-type Ser/Thr phosphatase n=1 Tax=Gracilibacillus sp. YIM 98692 TaxID=2663532 RepID=UPI0013D122AA|nr:Stp1/IreP family PP2C-type Ser/Thr phosphatase [Gracilibacillus sp. YIM 98692]
MKWYCQTDKGKVRHYNEDAAAVLNNEKNYLLAMVADGMGGHQAGDVASQLTLETLETYWNDLQVPLEKEEAEKWLYDAVIAANAQVFQKSQQDPSCQGMGTTVVVALCTESFIIVAHIGDSRAYLINDLEYVQLTKDHSLVGELVRSGQLSEEDARVHPRKNVILKALGTEQQVEPDIHMTTWERFDKLILCSDGLTNKLTDEELHQYLKENVTENTVKELIQKANDRGGEDNISIAIVDHTKEVGDTSC